MKNGKAPTISQSRMIRVFFGLGPEPPEDEKGKPSEWLVVKDTPAMMEIVQRETGKTREIRKVR
jgi:hypothetical protein